MERSTLTKKLGGLWMLYYLEENGKPRTIYFFPGSENPDGKTIEEIKRYPRLGRDVTFREALAMMGAGEIPKTLHRRSELFKELAHGNSMGEERD